MGTIDVGVGLARGHAWAGLASTEMNEASCCMLTWVRGPSGGTCGLACKEPAVC
jgi:hypothetical protein